MAHMHFIRSAIVEHTIEDSKVVNAGKQMCGNSSEVKRPELSTYLSADGQTKTSAGLNTYTSDSANG